MARIQVRDDAPPSDDDVFVIHMGAGSVETVVAGALRNHDSYIGVLDTTGRFTVSVFAATNGVSEEDILAALPQGQFGRASFGELRRHSVSWLATSIIDHRHPPDMARLQRVHFDLLVPVAGIDRYVADMAPHELQMLRDSLRAPVAGLLALFAPRRSK